MIYCLALARSVIPGHCGIPSERVSQTQTCKKRVGNKRASLAYAKKGSMAAIMLVNLAFLF